MDAFNYLGGNVQLVSQELATHLCTGHCCIIMALNVRRTHDVLCPAESSSRYSVLTCPNEHMDTEQLCRN